LSCFFFNCTLYEASRKEEVKRKREETRKAGRNKTGRKKKPKLERRKQERIQYLCTRTWQVEGDAAAHTNSEVGFALQTAVLLRVRSVEPKIPIFRVGALPICLFHITN